MNYSILAIFVFFFASGGCSFLHNPQFARTHHFDSRCDAIASQQLGEFETLDITDTSNRNVRLYDFSSSDPIDYREMWNVQKLLVDAHVDRLKVEFTKTSLPENQFISPELYDQKEIRSHHSIENQDLRLKSCDSIIFLQHNPVYTLGTASNPEFVKLDEEMLNDLGIDLIRIERGGEATYHGPGQLTVYPIFDLRGYKQDIHWYMRALEEAIIIALNNIGIDADREDDVTGVWVDNKKVAALGVKVRRWCTFHGLAVNVDQRALGNFEGIVPCGLEGREVGCVNDFLDEPITVEEFSSHLKKALEEVFQIKINR